ncbi:MAG: dUTP diphosphatase [Clostridia bacterium]|nr:dUTP diphosphatase [Clostridia bacterium]
MKIQVVNHSGLPLPEYKTEGSAGMDLCCAEESVTLDSLERALISTGLYMEIPVGYEGQVRPRSGLSIKHGVSLINCTGTIDSDYRGELRIPVVNLSKEPYTIKRGDRIAQLIFAKVEKGELIEVESISETDRGHGGFGSTGL